VLNVHHYMNKIVDVLVFPRRTEL